MAKPQDDADPEGALRLRCAAEGPPLPSTDADQGDLNLRFASDCAAVLVVDDEASVCRTVSLMLKCAGFSVMTAASGAEALSRLASADCPVQVVITDQNMPGMTGSELALRMLAAGIDLPVLFMSGQPQRDLTSEGQARAPRRFLAKPFTQATLLQEVKALLRSARCEADA